MARLSKYMQRVIQNEEDRIRARILATLLDSFRAHGYAVSISLDRENTTEKRFKTNAAACAYAFGDNAGLYAWAFAYAPGAKRGDKPRHWVLLVPSNAEDIISDYNTGCEDIIKPALELARTFD
jgi:hypothetical protein